MDEYNSFVTELRERLSPELTSTLTDFARACKAAARAVSLYPAAHPAIAQTLGRLVDSAGRATAAGPLTLQIKPDGLLVDGAAPARPDAAIGELAQLLYQHMVGILVVNSGADQQTWRALLLLLARTPEDNRADGGIQRLWTRTGGPSIEIHEIDFAEVLREREGDEARLEEIIASCLKDAPRLELDEQAMLALLAIVKDPEKLRALVARLQEAATAEGRASHAAAFLKLLRGLAEYVARHQPAELERVLKTMADAAGRLSADAMVTLLAQRMTGEAKVGTLDVVGAVVDRISDPAIAGFVADNVIEDRGATERLAQAFETLVPDTERKQQLLALAEEQVAQSPLGREETFEELWQRVEKMLTTYSDKRYVSDEYARELSMSRGRAVDVEKTADDPPDRIASWLGTVSDAAIRDLDLQLLTDLLNVETDPARWRDVAEAVVMHIDDLARVGQLEPAWHLAELVATEWSRRGSNKAAEAAGVIERLARGALFQQSAKELRRASDEDFVLFARVSHMIGPGAIPPLAEALAAEQDPKARRRIREVLVAYGSRGRQAIQELLNASNWEVRRTAAYLLTEFGGAENAAALEPLLNDPEPRVQREALRAVILSGQEQTFDLVVRALGPASAARRSLASELITMKEERAAPLLSYLLPRIDRQALRPLFLAAIDTLGTFGGTEAVDALKAALYEGNMWAPLKTRAHRAAAADALRRIGTEPARSVLREAAASGPRGVRAAARAQLKGASHG
jgi:HEAT repeat protein